MKDINYIKHVQCILSKCHYTKISIGPTCFVRKVNLRVYTRTSASRIFSKGVGDSWDWEKGDGREKFGKIANLITFYTCMYIQKLYKYTRYIL